MTYSTYDKSFLFAQISDCALSCPDHTSSFRLRAAKIVGLERREYQLVPIGVCVYRLVLGGPRVAARVGGGGECERGREGHEYRSHID